jgi:hypothetical protein
LPPNPSEPRSSNVRSISFKFVSEFDGFGHTPNLPLPSAIVNALNFLGTVVVIQKFAAIPICNHSLTVCTGSAESGKFLFVSPK